MSWVNYKVPFLKDYASLSFAKIAKYRIKEANKDRPI